MATTGLCPFADQRITARKRFVGNRGHKAVVLHIAEGSYLGTLQEFSDNSPAEKSSHFVVAKDGRIAQIVNINDSAWANGLCWQVDHWRVPDCSVRENPTWVDIVPGSNPNLYTISIEHEGFTGQPLTDAMKAATVRLLRWIAGELNLVYTPGRTLIRHGEISPGRKGFCPGPAFNFNEFAQAANAPSSSTAITENTALLSPPRATLQQARTFIANRGGSTAYTPQDIDLITQHYWTHAPAGGLDPLLALAQCIHETSDNGHPISSWWSKRPRRNPAGLGVNGDSRTTDPNDSHNWAFDSDANPPTWRAGLSFATFELGVRAQVGRLLAYALPAGQATPQQQALIDFALAQRPLPASLRGTAPTLKPLGSAHNPTGQGWAAPGTQYGMKIAAIAEAIRNS
ncbi:MAG: peptidoglycan recognition family protein [Chloroflexia bacterium]